MIQGKRDSEIAQILSASPRTIHHHVRNILRKLNTETRTAASLYAIESVNHMHVNMSIGNLADTQKLDIRGESL
jgi:hypothetical protein